MLLRILDGLPLSDVAVLVFVVVLAQLAGIDVIGQTWTWIESWLMGLMWPW